MHYTIERTRKDEPFGDILESFRRAGTDAGKAQAYALARGLTRKHPDSTVFVNEVQSRDETMIIAVSNPNEQVREQYPGIEYLDRKKFNKLLKAFTDAIREEMKSGSSEEDAKQEVLNVLSEA